jgi:S1-C subfamily serine protease
MQSCSLRNGYARNEAVKRGGVVLMLAATLAAGGVHAAEQVERADDAARPAKESAKESKTELDSKLQEAQKRLQRAASEVAALSAEIAGQVMEGVAKSFADMPRRTVIGVQLQPGADAGGARVQDVSPGGPAEQAGIRAGDVIVAVNGKDVKGQAAARDVVRLLRDVAPDSKVKVRVMRDGKPKDFDVIARPFDPHTFAYQTDAPPGFNPIPYIDPAPFAGRYGPFNYTYGFHDELEGMELTALTPQLGHYFGTDKGVLVLRAPQNDAFKLQDGDVILTIDGRTPTSGSHITRILRSYQPGEKLTLRVMRDRKPVDLEVTLPDSSRNRRTRATRVDVDAQPL